MKDIYLVHVDGYIGSYLPGEKPKINYKPQENFIDFVLMLKKKHPDYKPRCVINEGIAEAVRKKIQADKILQICHGNCR